MKQYLWEQSPVLLPLFIASCITTKKQIKKSLIILVTFSITPCFLFFLSWLSYIFEPTNVNMFAGAIIFIIGFIYWFLFLKKDLSKILKTLIVSLVVLYIIFFILQF